MNMMMTDTSLPDGSRVDLNGNRFLSGNGHLGLRGTLDEHTKREKTAIIVNGLYDRVGSAWREPVNAPNGCFFSLSRSGREMRADNSSVVSHEQGLDYGHAVQFRDTLFRTHAGTMAETADEPRAAKHEETLVRLRSRRFVSLTTERLICIEYEVSSDTPVTLAVSTSTEGDVWDLNGPHLGSFTTSVRDGISALSAVTTENGIQLHVVEFTSAPANSRVGYRQGENSFTRDFELDLKAGEKATFRKYIVVQDGLRGTRDEAFEECAGAAREGFDSILARHSALWEERWNACDIRIDGDPEAEEALRFSMYHLLAAAPVFSEGLSIPARGLSGQVYKGGIFWDTEMFMLPFFLSSFPELARKLLVYRIRTLDGARRKAKEYGYGGAFFAWESQETGDDACTLFNVTDVFTGRPMRTFFRDRQIHISADIAWAFGRYYETTGDVSLFLEGGAEVVYECARFLVSWLYYKPDRDRYELLDVTGPDEYHERVHNDYFTNLITIRSLETCLSMDRLLRNGYPRERKNILSRLGMEREIRNLNRILEKLYLPAPDPGTLVIEQFDGYLELEDVPLSELLSRKLHPDEYLGGGNGPARWTRIIKQADVVLAMALFTDGYPASVREANWNYYDPRTEHGSSLSACAYSMAAARLGKTDEAYAYFMKTATVDMTGDSRQYVGDLYIGGTHPAANGGAWMAAVYGFCGLSLTHNSLSLDPILPSGWKKIELIVAHSGRRLSIVISAGSILISADRPLDDDLTVRAGGRTHGWKGVEPLRIVIGGTVRPHGKSPSMNTLKKRYGGVRSCSNT